MSKEVFYVSVIDPDTNRRGLLSGPYPTKATAENDVERVRGLAEDADAFAAFYAFGTAGITDPAVAAQVKPVFGAPAPEYTGVDYLDDGLDRLAVDLTKEAA